jgi:hypothetical protein
LRTHGAHGEDGLTGIEQCARAPDGRDPDPAGGAYVRSSVRHDDHVTSKLLRKSDAAANGGPDAAYGGEAFLRPICRGRSGARVRRV